MKITARFMYLNVVIIAIAIACATLFSIVQMRSEAFRQATLLQESHIKTFWELLGAKGKEFRTIEGKLLAGDYVINGNYELPDKVKEIFGGAATIFMDEIRVSTNVLLADGSRAVATRLKGPAYEAVFRLGQSYRGEADILGVPYFAAYDPIRNNRGEVIGALFVGVKKSDFFSTYEKLKVRQIAGAAALIAIFTFLAFLLVHERKKAEAALRESEERLKAILHGSPIPQFVIDGNHRVLYWNRALEESSGFRADGMVGTSNHWQAFYSEKHPCLADLLVDGEIQAIPAWYSGKCHKSALLDEAYEGIDFFPVLGDRGRWLHFTATVIRDSQGNIIGAVETLKDISRQKRAEEALQEQLHFLQELIDSIPNPIFYKDTMGRYLGCNKAFEEFLGREKAEIVDKTAYDISPGELADKYHAMDLALLQSSGIQVYEYSVQRADGVRQEVIFNKAVFTLKGGETGGIVGIILDITERKNMEDALRHSEERFRRTFDQSPVGAAIVSLDYRFLRVNAEFCRITGYSEQELLSLSLPDISHPEDLDSDLQMKKSLIAGEIDNFQMDKRYVRKDANVIWARLSVCLMKDASGMPLYFLPMMEDISERKKLEEEVRRSQKLDSLGVLAGGIAHDFNNLLTGIVGNISLAKMYLDPKNKAYGRLDEAERASERAKSLTYQLLTFSKGGAPIKRSASIGQLVTDAALFILRGSNVRCDFSIAEDLSPVEIDEGQMSQVIDNLIINAAQAMPEGGVIGVTVENAACGISTGAEECGYIRISIADHGAGIAEEHIGLIFDPYFTTKPNGNGLGLATVYSIVRNHGGNIDVESQPGMGTTFHVYIPTNGKHQPAVALNEPAPLPGNGRVLVMDDDEMILEVAGEAIRMLGYEVTLCREGKEAVDSYRKARDSGAGYAAVIMDLTIPGGMGGREAMAMLLALDPKVKGIVSSGYNNDPILASYRDYGFSGAVTKPYTMKELGETLQAVLGI